MSPFPYYELMRRSDDPKFLRLRIVREALKIGIKPAARLFTTTPKTVRKWLGRYRAEGYQGLNDQSKAPNKPHSPVPPAERSKAVELKKAYPSFGAQRLRRDFGVQISEKTLCKIWKQEGLLKKRRRKHKTKQDLREVKAQWRLFQQTCADTKDLYDIPEFWPQIQRLRLPQVQYTAREVVSGLQFLGYAQERSLAHATLFAETVLKHVKDCGIDLEDLQARVQTDNGSEFIGSWNARDDSAFTLAVQQAGAVHTTIPSGAHTWQADVETVHNLIEMEFYEVENFATVNDFFDKASTYLLWFNRVRKNGSKKNRSPWEILRSRDPTLPKRICGLHALDLDELLQKKLSGASGGYHVGQHPSRAF